MKSTSVRETSASLSTKDSTSTKTSTTAISPLPVNHLRFVNAYQAHGFKDANVAYQEVYRCNRASANASAYRLLEDARVRAEIARRVQADQGITKAFLESNLTYALSLANAAKDAAVIASVTMDCAKLAGFLV